MVNKIYITGDAQRPTPGQEPNIRWLYNMINAQIEHITGIKPTMLIGNKVLSLDDWLKTYRVGQKLSNNMCWHVQQIPRDGSFVIGFEMPTAALEQFQEAEIPYVDIVIYPIRYLDDVLFGIRGTIKYFGTEEYQRVAVRGIEFKVHANLIISKFQRENKTCLEENSCLVVGQTPIDRSVVQNGELYNLQRCRANIEEYISKFSKVYFKPHPADWEKKRNNFLYKMGCEKIEENLYQIMSDMNLKAVAGLSSSCLHEAIYFGKEAKWFMDDWARYYVPVKPVDFLNIGFWSNILKDYCEVKEDRPLWISDMNSRIRQICNSYWGYDFIAKR